jgi:hypothetical protein
MTKSVSEQAAIEPEREPAFMATSRPAPQPANRGDFEIVELETTSPALAQNRMM